MSLAVILTVLAQLHDARLETGRGLTSAFYEGRLDEVWSQAGPSFKRQFGASFAAFKEFRARVASDFGEELRLTAESAGEKNGLVVYTRLSTYSRWALGIELEWVWDPAKGMLVSMSATPADVEAPSPHEDYVARTHLKLPFRGAWNVLWGGRTWAENHHASVADMRFAMDLFIIKKGSSCAGDCSRNEQYYCWEKPVSAPAPGIIVEVANDRPDNKPSSPDIYHLYGNHVVIDHGNSEYSLMAHLRRASVMVQVGDHVQTGELIGLTGNSGMSTEPHLHYQLMDGPEWDKAQGLPARFFRYFADGKPVEIGELKRGQLVAPR
jgi:hypothetical protein